MASTIKIKNSSTAGAVPSSGDLVQGELAINVTDRRIFTENASGTVVELGTPSIDDNGNATAITIDSSENVSFAQNVGIGTSSPSYRLDVKNGNNNSGRMDNDGSQYTTLFWANNGTNKAYFSWDNTNTAIITGSDAASSLYTFKTAGAERMRIDSSGNLLVGTTTQNGSEKFGVKQTENNQGVSFYASNATYTNNVVLVAADRNTTNGSFSAIAYYNNTAGAFKFKVFDSGNVVNTNNSYGAISDEKLKENVTDATPKLVQLNKVRVVNYNFIGDKHKQLGVIAQELEKVFPAMVEETPDRDKEGNDLGTTTKSVKYSVFVPMLIKAIQEQQAMIASQSELITTLTERITALEQA